jgi:hypothetical protein
MKMTKGTLDVLKDKNFYAVEFKCGELRQITQMLEQAKKEFNDSDFDFKIRWTDPSDTAIELMAWFKKWFGDEDDED